MGQDKKAHTVSVCYLKNFAYDKQLHCYSKIRREHYSSPVEAVCQSQYFYLIKEKSWWKQMELEKDFLANNVEQGLSRMIKTFEDSVNKIIIDDSFIQPLKFDEGTRRSIASQIFIQYYRTPRFRKQVEGKTLIRKGISIETHKYKEEKVTDEVLVHALSKFCNKPLHEKTVEYLTNNQWIVRYSKKDVFLTSDNPVVWVSMKDEYPNIYNIGDIGEDCGFLFYPITPHIVLEIFDKRMKSLSPDFDNILIKSDSEQEAFFNYMTIQNAEDTVILRDKNINAYSIDVKLEII